MISVEKPGSPKEILEQSGIKGMKWGVRKVVDTTIGTKTAGRRPSSRKKPKTLKEKEERRKKIIALTLGSTMMLAGTAFVADTLITSGALRIR